MAKQKANPEQKELQSWLDDIAGYERAFKSWEGRVDKILKRYRDETRTGSRTWTEAKFNILWSNVQTLTAATFARLPKPDVFRAHRDQDPVARVAALLLERCLDYHIQHYKQYRTALKANVLDRFLGGRGTAWIRYEPHFRAAQMQPPDPVDGPQITEDVDEPHEELDYECVAVDYVHYKDFGHSVARSWDEVTRVWRKVYMTKEALVDRFGEEIAKLVPMDADSTEIKRKEYGIEDAVERATIFEGWDRDKREAVWFSKAAKRFLDRRDDPLGLEEVFPCAKPLYATLTNDTLVPVPDFVIYQDQATELDLLADKIDGLTKALKITGGYDASIPELGRIFTESENGTLIPVKNWAAFAEKNGLQGAISLVDLKPIADALLAAYQAFKMIKDGIDELTGISDLMRGETKAAETATAQQLKANYGSMRLKDYQDQVSGYASELLNLMAQVICMKFSAQTIAQVGGAAQLSPEDQQYVQPALELLIGPERMADPDAVPAANPARDFRIEVSTDSMVFLDEQQEKQSRVEFLTATGGYLKAVSEAVVQMPPEVRQVMVPLLMDMLKFGVSGYRVGKTIEGAFEAAAEQLKQLAKQPPPPPQPPPEVLVEQMRGQLEQQRMGEEMALEREKAQQQMALDREKHQNDMLLAREKQAADIALARDQMAIQDQQHQAQMSFEREKMQTDTAGKVKEAFTAHQGKVKDMVSKVEQSQASADGKRQGSRELGDLHKSIKRLTQIVSSERKIVRGPDGRAQSSYVDVPPEEPEESPQEQSVPQLVAEVQDEMSELAQAIQALLQQLSSGGQTLQ